MKKLVFLLFVGAGSPLLQADVIYSNFGSPLAFQPDVGSTVASGGTDFSTAFSFTVQNSSYQVTGIDYAAFLQAPGGTNLITASLYSDNGGLPGTLLYTTAPDTGLQLLNAIEFMDTVTGGPILNAGSTYWLSLDAPIDSSTGWAASGDNNAIGIGAQFTDGNWASIGGKVQGAFEVDGIVAAPEPVTTSLFISGFASLVLLRRYKFKLSN